jgi:hypothetical protein
MAMKAAASARTRSAKSAQPRPDSSVGVSHVQIQAAANSTGKDKDGNPDDVLLKIVFLLFIFSCFRCESGLSSTPNRRPEHSEHRQDVSKQQTSDVFVFSPISII